MDIIGFLNNFSDFWFPLLVLAVMPVLFFEAGFIVGRVWKMGYPRQMRRGIVYKIVAYYGGYVLAYPYDSKENELGLYKCSISIQPESDLPIFLVRRGNGEVQVTEPTSI